MVRVSSLSQDGHVSTQCWWYAGSVRDHASLSGEECRGIDGLGYLARMDNLRNYELISHVSF